MRADVRYDRIPVDLLNSVDRPGQSATALRTARQWHLIRRKLLCGGRFRIADWRRWMSFLDEIR
jgi:hypothetical protein